jgi:hypothetical protein
MYTKAESSRVDSLQVVTTHPVKSSKTDCSHDTISWNEALAEHHMAIGSWRSTIQGDTSTILPNAGEFIAEPPPRMISAAWLKNESIRNETGRNSALDSSLSRVPILRSDPWKLSRSL